MTAQTQKAVTFYGDTLIAIRQDDSGAIFVPLARLCDSLGIARARQAQRIREYPVISRGFETLNIETPGGAQEAQCLRLDMIPLWLSGVNANRVSDAVRVHRWLIAKYCPTLLAYSTVTPSDPWPMSGESIWLILLPVLSFNSIYMPRSHRS